MVCVATTTFRSHKISLVAQLESGHLLKVLESLLRNTTSISPSHFNSQNVTAWMLYSIATTNPTPSKAMNTNIVDLLQPCMEIKISGPSTPVPKQWNKYISNPQNIGNLTAFLSHTWCQISQQELHHGQVLVMGGGYKEYNKAV